MKYLITDDAGSTLLGFAIAFLTLDFYRSNPASLPAASFPVFVAALPLLDAALAIIRRLRQAQSLVHGDRSHIYDVLLTRGWQSRNVALVFCGLSAVLAGLAWLALSTRQTVFILADAVIVVTVLVTAIGLGSLGPAENKVGGELDHREIASSRSAR